MTEIRNKACGIDVHKRILVATLLARNGEKTTRNFPNTVEGCVDIRTWVSDEKCDVVAFESTSVYWRKLYGTLLDTLDLEVANAYSIKNVPGKKTDTRDSEWIAQLALNRLITPSRILSEEDEEFRKLTRYRSHLVKERTMVKNMIHRLLDEDQILLSRVLSDIFGKTGLTILDEIANGGNLERVLNHLPPRLRAKKELFLNVLSSKLSQSNLQILQGCIRRLKHLNEEIMRMDDMIVESISITRKEDYTILMSIPGIGPTLAAQLLSEIGPISDFAEPAKLVSFAGLNPSVAQSAGVLRTGHITKKGNSHLRWMAVEAAQCCIKKKGTALYEFYARLKKKCGFKKAIVALARKLLVLIWHLLTNKEMYEDEGYVKKGNVSIPGFMKLVSKIGTNEAIELIQKASEIMKVSTLDDEKMKDIQGG